MILGDDVILGSVVGSDEAVSATPSGKVVVSFPAKCMLRRGFLRPVSSSQPKEDVVLALGSVESSSKGLDLVGVAIWDIWVREGVSNGRLILPLSVSDEAAPFSESDEVAQAWDLVPVLDPILDQGLDPVPGGGLSGEQAKDFNRVFLEMFPDSASCSQGSVSNIPMENGLTIPQWWLLEWLKDQVKHDEAQLVYLKDVEEEARLLNKVAIPPGAVEGSELMQSELMQVVMRDLGL